MSRKQCFILGPMRTDDDERKMKTIQRVMQRVLNNMLHLTDFDPPMTPYDLGGGDISMNVIEQIDRAEIVVINITGNNPNVYYELAMCHSLGIPCIMVKENDGNSVSFYAARNLCLTLNMADENQMANVLATHIGHIFHGRNPEVYRDSPVRQYFTRPIVDISPAVGTALGYYLNFLQHIIEGLGNVNENDQCRHFFGTKTSEQDDEGNDKFQELPRDYSYRQHLHYRIVIPTRISYADQKMVNKLNNSQECVKGSMYHRLTNGKNTRPYGITFRKLDIDSSGRQLYEIIEIPTSMNPMAETIDLRMRVKRIEPNREDPSWRHQEELEINRFHQEVQNLINYYGRLRFPGPTYANKVSIVRYDPTESADGLRQKDLLWLRNCLDN